MPSALINKTCVQILNCVYYGLNRNQTSYAYRKLRFSQITMNLPQQQFG